MRALHEARAVGETDEMGESNDMAILSGNK
jgi:hypothetical protein